ncbi:MAG: preprotein translocase subunit SecY [Erysipelotrichaceae bacterium]|jgi:preprotein translocase subunit SecY|nr:preprotein translocase subunit SecY [Erysipelotrichaceae bacterium]MBQ1304002.1 preprotein translocase subunit SecY [Erysipelotrichaceae bacterium]MBQ2685637.1 preprotein translocase subunit SecY [Erysipelotrichaceae bacterium]MBR2792257.1 preprotein translocase subunit SecY [Erysipelotrichaceae bacterium]MBR2826707.1 preprotein translocase subunit SecY [Erysipelotrichaceae bacterium]
MLKTFISFFENKDIRRKILFTLGMLLVFRLGAAITVPNIDTSKLVTGLSDNDLIAMMNMLGAGSWQTFSVFSMGVGPYITASIVIELLAMDVIPPLAELAKDGQKGRQKMDKITRYLAVVLAFAQAYTLTMTFDKAYGILENNTVTAYLYTATILTAGSFFLVWIGDRIAAHGIGNGISMIIFAGIVANLPYQFYSSYVTLVNSAAEGEAFTGVLKFVLLVLMYIAIIVLVIYETQATRKIPIQYTSSTTKRNSANLNYLPLKINSASVIPVIFASTIMVAPKTIMALISNASWYKTTDFTTKLINIFDYISDFTKIGGLLIYVVLIFFFTFFYTNLQVDPAKITENLNKSGTYIPGIRPGKETQTYISMVLNRITLLGALFLCFIAALPHLLSMFTNIPSTITMGGTSIIIVVGVALETVKDLEDQLTQKEYKGFMKR